jgi:hypothetical protein
LATVSLFLKIISSFYSEEGSYLDALAINDPVLIGNFDFFSFHFASKKSA